MQIDTTLPNNRAYNMIIETPRGKGRPEEDGLKAKPISHNFTILSSTLQTNMP